MSGRLSMRWYDHKAYTVCVDQAETPGFVIATHAGWELRVRPDGPLDPGPDDAHWFAKLRDVRHWLGTGEGGAWLVALSARETTEAT